MPGEIRILGPDGLPVNSHHQRRESGHRLGSGYRAAAFGILGGDFDSGTSGFYNDFYGGLTGGDSYEGAGESPDLAGWTPFNYSGQSALTWARDRLATRIHDLVRSDGWSSTAVSRNLDAVIGAGWELHSLPIAKALGIEDDAAQELAAQIEMVWKGYSEDPQVVDSEQRLPFSGLLALGYRHYLIDGESFSISEWIDDDNREWKTAVKMIDPDRISNPFMWLDTVSRRGGVEMGPHGNPIGYHIRSAHPGDLGVIGMFPWIWEYVEKKYPNGRWQAVHSYKPQRAGQIRAEPPLAPILRKVRMIQKYDSAELQAAVLNALLAAFVQSPNDPDQIARSMEGDELSPMQEQRLGFYERAGISMPNVRVQFMYPNDEVNLLTPKHPNANFESFMRVGLRNMASAAGITYEQLTGDYSATNYSSARAAMLEIWRGFLARRGEFQTFFVQPHFENWLEEAFEKGVIKYPPGAPPFRAAKAAYTNANWIGPGRGYVDPFKEAQASLIRLSSGLSTLQIECGEQGYDWKEVIQQRSREADALKKLGLEPSVAKPQFSQTPENDNNSDNEKEDA